MRTGHETALKIEDGRVAFERPFTKIMRVLDEAREKIATAEREMTAYEIFGGFFVMQRQPHNHVITELPYVGPW